MHDIALHLKIASIAILVFSTSLLFLAGRFSPRAVASGFFTLSVAGYLGCQLCHAFSVPQWFFHFVHVGCFVVPLAFYLLTESLFEDTFKFRWAHLLLFIFIEFINFFLIIYLQVYSAEAYNRFGEIVTLLRAAPQTVSLAFILFALGKILIRRRTDLVEKRRSFRLKFIGLTSFYMILVLVSELAFQGKHAPVTLDLVHSIGILITVWYFAARIFTVREGTLGDARAIVKEATNVSERVEPNPELLAKLQMAMSTDKIYTQEGLSIRQLAEHLGTQEYLLRRLINAALGYKNFNDYLNEIRITEAARILADKEQVATPVIRIAMDMGFGSLAPFNKAFRERQGMTPTEYRKQRNQT